MDYFLFYLSPLSITGFEFVKICRNMPQFKMLATESFSGVWILQSFFPNKNIILMEFCSIKHSFFSLTNIIAFR